MNSDASLDALAKELSDFVARRHTTRKADGSTVTTGEGIKLPDGTIVEDGDTIRTKGGKTIRDSAGDTPEIAKVITGKHGEVRTGQAAETGGEEAKQARATLMQDGYTVGDTNGTDDYGRTVGQTVDAQGRDIGITLAEAGLATPTVEHYNNRAGLAAYTDYIRESGGVSAGMWRDPAIEGQRLAAKRGREQDGKSLPPGLVPPKDGYVRDNGTAANSWDRGVDMTQGMGYGFLEAVGEATGIDAVAEFGKAGRERNAAERDLHPAKVPTLFHAETTGDYATYAVEKIIENTPNMAVTMATAALASVAAPAAAGLLSPAAAAGVRAAVPTIAGIAVTPKVAGIAGALASSYVLNAGEVQENLKEVDPNASTGGLALIAGVPAAALDAPLIGTVASALTAPLQKGLMSGVKEIAKRTGKAAVKGFAAEAPTEGGQEVNSILFEEILGGDKYDVFSRRNLERVVDATAAGGLSGMATTATMHLGREGLTAATGGYAKPAATPGQTPPAPLTPPEQTPPAPLTPPEQTPPAPLTPPEQTPPAPLTPPEQTPEQTPPAPLTPPEQTPGQTPAPQDPNPTPQDPNPTPQGPNPASSPLDNPTLVPEPKAALIRQVEIVAESDNGLHTMYVESSNPSYEDIRSKATLESADVNIIEVPEGIPGIPAGLLVTSVDGVNKTPQTAAELESFGISANNSAEDNLAALDKILHFGADTPTDTGVWGKSWLLDNPTNGLAVVVRDAKNGNAVVKSRLVPADNPAEIGRTEELFKKNFSDPRYTVERASVEDVLNERVATQGAPTEAPTSEASTPVVVPPVADPAPEAPTEVPTPEAPTEVPTPEAPTEVPTPEAPTEVPTPEAPTGVPTPEVPTGVPTPEVPTGVPTPEVKAEVPAQEVKADPNALPLSDPSKPTKSPHPLRKLLDSGVRKLSTAARFLWEKLTKENHENRAKNFASSYPKNSEQLKSVIRFLNSKSAKPLPEDAEPATVFDRAQELWNSPDVVLVGTPKDPATPRTAFDYFDPAYPVEQKVKVDGTEYSTVYQAILAAFIPAAMTFKGGSKTIRDELAALDKVFLDAVNDSKTGPIYHEKVTSKLNAFLNNLVEDGVTLRQYLNNRHPSPSSVTAKLVNLYLQRFTHPDTKEMHEGFATWFADNPKLIRFQLGSFGGSNPETNQGNPSANLLNWLSADSTNQRITTLNKNLAGFALMMAGDWLAAHTENPSVVTPSDLITEDTGATSLPEAFFEAARSHILIAKTMLFKAFGAAGVAQPEITGDPDVLTEEQQEQVVTGHLKALYIVDKRTIFIAPRVLELLADRSVEAKSVSAALHAVFHEGGHHVLEMALADSKHAGQVANLVRVILGKKAEFSSLSSEEQATVREAAANMLAGALARRFGATRDIAAALALTGETNKSIRDAAEYSLARILKQLSAYYGYLKDTFKEVFSTVKITVADAFLQAVMPIKADSSEVGSRSNSRASPAPDSNSGKTRGGTGKIADALRKAKALAEDLMAQQDQNRDYAVLNESRLRRLVSKLAVAKEPDPLGALEFITAVEALSRTPGDTLSGLSEVLSRLAVPAKYTPDILAVQELIQKLAEQIGAWTAETPPEPVGHVTKGYELTVAKLAAEADPGLMMRLQEMAQDIASRLQEAPPPPAPPAGTTAEGVSNLIGRVVTKLSSHISVALDRRIQQLRNRKALKLAMDRRKALAEEADKSVRASILRWVNDPEAYRLHVLRKRFPVAAHEPNSFFSRDASSGLAKLLQQDTKLSAELRTLFMGPAKDLWLYDFKETMPTLAQQLEHPESASAGEILWGASKLYPRSMYLSGFLDPAPHEAPRSNGQKALAMVGNLIGQDNWAREFLLRAKEIEFARNPLKLRAAIIRREMPQFAEKPDSFFDEVGEGTEVYEALKAKYPEGENLDLLTEDPYEGVVRLLQSRIGKNGITRQAIMDGRAADILQEELEAIFAKKADTFMDGIEASGRVDHWVVNYFFNDFMNDLQSAVDRLQDTTLDSVFHEAFSTMQEYRNSGRMEVIHTLVNEYKTALENRLTSIKLIAEKQEALEQAKAAKQDKAVIAELKDALAIERENRRNYSRVVADTKAQLWEAYRPFMTKVFMAVNALNAARDRFSHGVLGDSVLNPHGTGVKMPFLISQGGRVTSPEGDVFAIGAEEIPDFTEPDTESSVDDGWTFADINPNDLPADTLREAAPETPSHEALAARLLAQGFVQPTDQASLVDSIQRSVFDLEAYESDLSDEGLVLEEYAKISAQPLAQRFASLQERFDALMRRRITPHTTLVWHFDKNKTVTKVFNDPPTSVKGSFGWTTRDAAEAYMRELQQYTADAVLMVHKLEETGNYVVVERVVKEHGIMAAIRSAIIAARNPALDKDGLVYLYYQMPDGRFEGRAVSLTTLLARLPYQDFLTSDEVAAYGPARFVNALTIFMGFLAETKDASGNYKFYLGEDPLTDESIKEKPPWGFQGRLGAMKLPATTGNPAVIIHEGNRYSFGESPGAVNLFSDGLLLSYSDVTPIVKPDFTPGKEASALDIDESFNDILDAISVARGSLAAHVAAHPLNSVKDILVLLKEAVHKVRSTPEGEERVTLAETLAAKLELSWNGKGPILPSGKRGKYQSTVVPDKRSDRVSLLDLLTKDIKPVKRSADTAALRAERIATLHKLMTESAELKGLADTITGMFTENKPIADIIDKIPADLWASRDEKTSLAVKAILDLNTPQKFVVNNPYLGSTSVAEILLKLADSAQLSVADQKLIDEYNSKLADIQRDAYKLASRADLDRNTRDVEVAKLVLEATGLRGKIEALMSKSGAFVDNLEAEHIGAKLGAQNAVKGAPKVGANAMSYFDLQTARWNLSSDYWLHHPLIVKAFKGVSALQYMANEGWVELKSESWHLTEKGKKAYETAQEFRTHVPNDVVQEMKRLVKTGLDPRAGARTLHTLLLWGIDGDTAWAMDENGFSTRGRREGDIFDSIEQAGKEVKEMEQRDQAYTQYADLFETRETRLAAVGRKDQSAPYSPNGLFGEDALDSSDKSPQVSVHTGGFKAGTILGEWLTKLLRALGIETKFKLVHEEGLTELHDWATVELNRLRSSIGLSPIKGRATAAQANQLEVAIENKVDPVALDTDAPVDAAEIKRLSAVRGQLSDLRQLLEDIERARTGVQTNGAAIIYANYQSAVYRTPVIVLSTKLLRSNMQGLDTLKGRSKLIREVGIQYVAHEVGHFIHRSILSSPQFAQVLKVIADELNLSLDDAAQAVSLSESLANQLVLDLINKEQDRVSDINNKDAGTLTSLWRTLVASLKAALTKLYNKIKGSFGYSARYEEFINDLYKRASNNEKVLYGGTVQSSKFYMDGPRVDLFHEELDHGGRAAARWVGRMTSAGWNKLLSNSKTGLPALRVADAVKSVGELAGSAWSSVISSHIVRMKELNLRTGSRAAMLLLNASGHTPDTLHAYTFPTDVSDPGVADSTHSVPERLRAELGLFADQFEALAERIAKDNPPKGWFRKATQWIHKTTGPRQSYYVGIKGTTAPLGEFTTRKEAYNEKLRLQQDPAYAGKTFAIVKRPSSSYREQVRSLLHRTSLGSVTALDQADRRENIAMDLAAVAEDVEGFAKAVAELMGVDYTQAPVKARIDSLVGYLRAENGAILTNSVPLAPSDPQISADYALLRSELVAKVDDRGAVAKYLRDGKYDLARQALDLLSEIRYHAVNRLGVRLEQSGEYLPLILDIETVMPNKAEFVQTIAAILPDDPLAGTKVQRAENLVEFFMDNNGVVLDLNTRSYTDHTQVFADYNALLMAFASNLDVRKEISKYLLDDVMGMLVHYQHALFKKGVTDLYYGKIDDMGAMDPVGRLKELLQSDRGLTSAEREWLMNVVYPMLMGRFNRGSFHPAVRRLFSATMLYQFIRLLPFATLSSFIDPGVTALRLGLKNTWDGLQAVRREGYGALYEAARLLGIVMEEGADHILSDAMNAQYMTLGVKKVSEAFFRAIGLTQWTNLMRVIAASASVNYLRDLNTRLEEADRLTAQSGTLAPAVRRSIARAQREFQELQVSRETLRDWLQSGTTTEELLRNARLRGGFSEMNALLQRLNSDSVLRPNVGDRPHWANNPLLSLIWMLKQFMWLFHNKVLVRVWEETKAADRPGLLRLVPAITMIAFLMPLAFLGFGLRKLLTGDLDRQLEKTPGELTAEMFERSGVPGVFQLLIDAERSADAKKVAFLTFLGPVVEQASGFFMEPMDLWVARSIPISSSSPWVRNKLREYLKQDGNDEE